MKYLSRSWRTIYSLHGWWRQISSFQREASSAVNTIRSVYNKHIVHIPYTASTPEYSSTTGFRKQHAQTTPPPRSASQQSNRIHIRGRTTDIRRPGARWATQEHMIITETNQQRLILASGQPLTLVWVSQTIRAKEEATSLVGSSFLSLSPLAAD